MKTENKRIMLPEMDSETVKKEISDFIIDIVKGSHATGCVIGLSGGVDSTTTAALIKYAFDTYNAQHDDKFELVAYLLPSHISSSRDTEDGIKVAERLGIRYEILPLDALLAAYATTNPEALSSPYDRGNLISRIRANILNTKAATERKVLAGTGNRDEDYGIGYYTLFGDGAVHMSPIGGLSKRLVRQMAAHLGFADLANREPTAGLEAGQTDFRDLGYRYDIVELVSEGIDQGLRPQELASHPQLLPLISRQIKEYASAYGSSKFITSDEVIQDIMRRKDIAQHKVKIIHPPTPSITLTYRGDA
jgi:NAD+ synthase